MAVEFAELAAGLPVAASLALAGGITSLREGRRRAALNEAIHELRRPLQVLSFAIPTDAPATAPAESSLRLASAALDRLDREINGASLEEAVTKVSVAGLIEEAAWRWRAVARRRGCTLEVNSNSEDTWVEGNRFDLDQALDNLLNNAIEHGGSLVRIEWRCEGSSVLVSVIDSGGSAGAGMRRGRALRDRRCRRGHGLRVVGRTARRHGGSFSLCRAPHRTEASLRLPLRRVSER